jgi:hypothetical protein
VERLGLWWRTVVVVVAINLVAASFIVSASVVNAIVTNVSGWYRFFAPDVGWRNVHAAAYVACAVAMVDALVCPSADIIDDACWASTFTIAALPSADRCDSREYDIPELATELGVGIIT